MELEYRKRKRVKSPKDSLGDELDFVVRYGLHETIYMVHPDNKNVKGTVLYKLLERNSSKRFIIYTDNTTENDELCVYSGYYHPYALINRVCPIETDEDWNIVERFLEYINDNKEGLY
jgi:uncharacterized protein YrzB (UPF0473 family)